VVENRFQTGEVAERNGQTAVFALARMKKCFADCRLDRAAIH
jgi:hypothetical protein